VGFGVTRDSRENRDETDGKGDDAGAMLDDGTLSPRDITPICSIWWLAGRNLSVGCI